LRCSLVVSNAGDPYWANVVLLLGFEGVDGSQGAPGFTDESSRHHGIGAVSPNGGEIDTAQFKFGSSSLILSGANQFVGFSDSPDWRLSSANSDQFTIECWVRFGALTASVNTIICQSFNPSNYGWNIEASAGGELRFTSSADGSTFNVNLVSSGAALATGVWYHVAVDKDSSGKIRLYKNGVPLVSVTPADSSMHDCSVPLQIGDNSWYTTPMTGWVDEVRITKGVARYHTDASFTPPTAAFPRGGV